MSAATASGGGGGMDGDDGKKRKRALSEEAPDLPSGSSDAPKKKLKGLSNSLRKSKSLSDLTELDTRIHEIAMKRRKEIRELEEAMAKLEAVELIVKAAKANMGILLDQHMDEVNQEEVEVDVDGDDKMATEEEEGGAEKSNAGASGSQPDIAKDDMVHGDENGGKK